MYEIPIGAGLGGLGAAGAARGLRGAGSFAGDLFGILDLPRQAGASMLASFLPEPPHGQMTPRSMAGYLSGIGGMAMPSPIAGQPNMLPRALGAGMMAGEVSRPPGGLPVTPTEADPLDMPWPPGGGEPKHGSVLPALLGLMAGAGSAMIPGIGTVAAPWVGAGAAGLAQALLHGADPNKYGSFSPEEISERAGFGDGFLPTTAVSMATDPLTYAGALSGARMGAARAASRTGPADRLAAFAAHDGAAPRFAPGMTQGGGPPAYLPPPPMPGPAPPPAAMPTLGGYSGEQLAGLNAGMPVEVGPEALLLNAAKGRQYKKVNPGLAELLGEMGYLNEGGALRTPTLPPWAEIRGGNVLPARGAQELFPHLQDLAGTNQTFDHAARMRMLQRLQGLG